MTGVATLQGQTLATSLKKCQFCLQESNKIIIMNWTTVYSSVLSCAFVANALRCHRQEREEPPPGSSVRGQEHSGLAPPASELGKGRAGSGMTRCAQGQS